MSLWGPGRPAGLQHVAKDPEVTLGGLKPLLQRPVEAPLHIIQALIVECCPHLQTASALRLQLLSGPRLAQPPVLRFFGPAWSSQTQEPSQPRLHAARAGLRPAKGQARREPALAASRRAENLNHLLLLLIGSFMSLK